jgi:hypothetical protein
LWRRSPAAFTERPRSTSQLQLAWCRGLRFHLSCLLARCCCFLFLGIASSIFYQKWYIYIFIVFDFSLFFLHQWLLFHVLHHSSYAAYKLARIVVKSLVWGYMWPRFSLSEIKIYRTPWIKRISKIYRKYRTKFKKKLIFFSKNL